MNAFHQAHYFRLASAEDFPEMLEVWEQSVRASHHFLKETDIIFFRNFIKEHQVFAQVSVTLATTSEGKIVGFLGVTEESIEMLFITPGFFGKGIGRTLLHHAVAELKIRKVDVNEQNTNARKFYERNGFEVVSRSEVDGLGKPFPILHMEMKGNSES